VLAYSVVLRVFDRSGVLVRTLDAGHADFQITALVFSSSPFDPSKGPLIISQAGWGVAFDGRADAGDLLPTGPYILKVTSSDASSTHDTQDSLVIMGNDSGALETVFVAPNPVLKTDNDLRIYWKPGIDIDLEVYNQAGEKIRHFSFSGPAPAIWDLTTATGQVLSNGIYLIVARQPGQKTPKIFKFSIIK
jgi:hypothetical protein